MKAILKSLYQYSRNKKVKELIFNVFNKDYLVRSYAARNKNTPVSILEKLSNDENVYVRSSVAKNIKTPISILEKLSNDEHYYVRYYAKENLKQKNKKKE